MDEIKIEKRVTHNDIKKAVQTPSNNFFEDNFDLFRRWQLQMLKDKQAQEIEFEIIQPKQISQ